MYKKYVELTIFIYLLGQINWLPSHLTESLKTLPIGLEISIHIHVTRGSTDMESIDWPSLSHSEKSSVNSGGLESTIPAILGSPSVRVIAGRPNLRESLREQRDYMRMGVSGK